MKRTILVGVMVLGTSFCSQSFGFDLLDRMLGLKGSGCDTSCCDTSFGGYGEASCGIEDPCGPCATEPTCGIGSGFGAGSACGGCAEAACGCEVATDCGCAEVGPSCGCEDACGTRKRGHLLHRLFSGLRCGHPQGCDSACGDACGAYGDPNCGSEGALGGGRGLFGGDPSCGCEGAFGGGHGLFGGGAPTCGIETIGDCGCGSCGTGACGCATGCDSLCGGHHRGGLLSRLFGRFHRNNDCCDTACDVAGGCSDCLSSPISAPMAPTMDDSSDEQVSPMPPAPVVDPSAYLHSKRRVIQASTHYTR